MFDNHIVLKLEFHFEDYHGCISRSVVCHREYRVSSESGHMDEEVKELCDDFFSGTFETLKVRIDKIVEDAKHYSELERRLDDLGYIEGKLSVSCTCGVGEFNGSDYESSKYDHNQNYLYPDTDRIRNILDDIHRDAEVFVSREVTIR